ncbi:hypothetical protein TALC_00216 [Thermoplasmatales archaeon BRNA1]|nr:hypothetical protein TALC_00216 [Thermoplasmatales archaeon BRNA1]
MSKRAAAGAVLAISLLVVLGAAIYMTSWDGFGDSPEPIPYDNVVEYDANGDPVAVTDGSLNETLFEDYGPVLLVLAILMFGAMIGGVCIAREEVEKDDSN